jgi:hypothetical protein
MVDANPSTSQFPPQFSGRSRSGTFPIDFSNFRYKHVLLDHQHADDFSFGVHVFLNIANFEMS